MQWDKLVAVLNERHEEDISDSAITILAFQVTSFEDEQTFSGIGLYVSHTPDQIVVKLGRSASVTWFGNELVLTRENTRIDIVNAADFVLDALELANKHVNSLYCAE